MTLPPDDDLADDMPAGTDKERRRGGRKVASRSTTR